MGRSRSRSGKRKPTRRNPRSNPRGVLSVSPHGYGFVKTAEGEFFVPESKMGSAFDGDYVEVAPSKVNRAHRQDAKAHNQVGERPTARVVAVVMRNHESIVGRYEIAEPFGVVVPEDPHIGYDVFTLHADHPHIQDGDIVRVRMVEYPSRHSAATGVIEEVLGHEGDAGLDVESVIARHKLEVAFSEAAIQEAEAARVDVEGALRSGYRDVRDRVVFTVDPTDARDFDDAVSYDEADGLHRVGVHIADVSHYVPWGSSVDLDARRRATSVYLVDRVIPMLPEALSNGVCSLRPHEDRRAVTVDMWFDDAGVLKRAEFYPSLIRSCARLSYSEAQAAIEKRRAGLPLAEGNADLTDAVCDRLVALSRVACLLSRNRRKAGGLDFELPEAKVRLGADGEPVDVFIRKKTEATSLIEECMIAANVAVAEHMEASGWPCVYRVHDKPDADALAALVPLLQEFSAYRDIPASAFVEGVPSVLQSVLRKAKGRPEEELVSSLLVRSMKRAVYRKQCAPHYGLAAAHYLHFTSPIRRYPDLIAHRMLKMQLSGRRSKDFDGQASAISWLAEHSSEMERVAESAARESQEIKLCELMASQVGQVFEGVVSGVATYGIFVRLPNTAEGLVPVRCLGDEYFSLDPVRRVLSGEESRRTFRVGRKVDVQLFSVDPRKRSIEFRLA